MRQRIEHIERQGPSGWGKPRGRLQPHPSSGSRRHPEPDEPGQGPVSSSWTLGPIEIDSRLGAAGLEPAAVHEIKPASATACSGAAAMTFALRLLQRLELSRQPSERREKRLKVLWCTTEHRAGETGRLYGRGLLSLGLDPRTFILVETRRDSETLWALEEGLKSDSLALVIGQLGEAGLIPARRLALAAEAHRTPCLLLTDSRTPVMAATASRWRIGPASSALHPFDARAPGIARARVTLERCRNRPLLDEPLPLLMEWCHETRRFRLAAGLAHRAHAPPVSFRRAG